MRRETRVFIWTALLALLGATVMTGPAGCNTEEGGASARVITNRGDLIGGERSLGDIGDLLIENERVRFVIQKGGPSRGFGVFGGSIIDADLRRTVERTPGGEGKGFDQFGEMFPAMFVQAIAVDSVQILNDGSDGNAASIEASGDGGDFFEMLAVFNRVITGSHASYLTSRSAPQLRYSTVYELEPGKQYLTVRFRAKNISAKVLTFPGADKGILEGAGLDTNGFTVPVGDVALFGATSHLFIPGVGYDLRFGLDRAYARGAEWPAFPGILADFIASQGEHTSYGLVARSSDRNFVMSHKDKYAGADAPLTDSTMLVPFTTSGAIGVFYENAPAELAVGETFEVVRHFVVGSGDVGSIVDVVNDIRGIDTGRLGAHVVDSLTGAPAEGASVVVYQGHGALRPYSQYDVKPGGDITGTLPGGQYSLRVVGDDRAETKPLDFDITPGKTTSLRVETEPPARIFIHVKGENGLPLPAKASAIGRYGAEHAGKETPSFLFDLEAGEDFRTTDMVDDDPKNPDTLRYIEGIAFTNEGVAELHVRPGTYDVVTSRGPEYQPETTTVTVDASHAATVAHTLKRVVDTTGWVAVDPHVHSRESTDSSLTLDERVRSLAAEGVEIPVATDHNVVTDYAPYVARNNLDEWMHPVVGVELTTLESGHFNGYPLRYDPGHAAHGSFEWAHMPPDEIFNRLRNLGRLGPGNTIIQVNHPRDEVLGYYGQYYRDALTHDFVAPSGFAVFLQPKGPAFAEGAGEMGFSFNYEAVELANGKLYREIHHYRVPDPLPEGELPEVVPPTGAILKDADGKVGFPGVVDDWFNLLNLGYSFIGVGSGDSHAATDEAGQFRTMVYVGDDRPAGMTDQRLVDGLRSRRVVVTNGPLLDFYIDDPERGAMGKTVVDGDGTVALSLSLTSAPWIGVGRVNVYRNGVIVHTMDVDAARDLAASPLRETVNLPLDSDAGGALKDSWFVVEAIGYKSMFPVIRPLEIPPLMLIDAVSSLAGPLGLGQDEFGALRPPEVFAVTAYAITNPVWVVRANGPFQAPGLVPEATQSKPENDPKLQIGVADWTVPKARRRVKRETNVSDRYDPQHGYVPLFDPVEGNSFDVRNALKRYGLPHGH